MNFRTAPTAFICLALSVSVFVFTSRSYCDEGESPATAELIGTALDGDQAAWKQLIERGMAAHTVLKTGAANTAKERAKLRLAIRHERDQKLLAKGLVVHEWGSYMYVQGSDNVIIDGLREDQSDLPDWVYVWTKIPRSAYPQIMIKPIVYFYTPKPVNVSVTLRNPSGMLTQWWPAATSFQPRRPHVGQPMPMAVNGKLTWTNIEVNPSLKPVFKKAPKGSWWPIARDTDSVPLRVNGQTEKFLFYRGIGTRKYIVQVTVDGDNVTLKNTSDHDIRHLYVINVVNGKALHQTIDRLAKGASIVRDIAVGDKATDAAKLANQTRAHWQEAMEEAGLFPKEARGMTGIWADEYLQHEGLRVLYLQPRPLLDAELSLSITGTTPADIVRCIVVRIECLNSHQEQRIADLVTQLGANAYKKRAAAEKELVALDRLGEAILRKALISTKDPEVRMRLKSIIKKMTTFQPNK